MLNVTIMSTVPNAPTFVVAVTEWEMRPRYDGSVDFVFSCPEACQKLGRAFTQMGCHLRAHQEEMEQFWAEIREQVPVGERGRAGWWTRWWTKIHEWIPKGL